MKRLFAASIGVGLLAVAALACQSAVGLNVTYKDGASDSMSSDSMSVVEDAGAEPEPAVHPGELEGCPCDRLQGLSCCVSAVGPAFCTTDLTRCNNEQGAFYGCFAPDPITESVCCWNGNGASSRTALAASCVDGGRLEACTKDTECPGRAPGSCHIKTCGTITVGACGAEPPECPPGT